MSEKRRVIEAGKSLLIVLLSILTVYLAGRAILYDRKADQGLFMGLEALDLDTAGSLGSAGVSRPVRMAVVNADGRYAVQYDDAGVDELFDALGDLLGQAVDSAGAAAPVEREEWEAALQERGVYYGFPGSVPLQLISVWLGEGKTALTAQASSLLLASSGREGKICLYYHDGDQAYYACDTGTYFGQRLDGYIPNGAIYAFQQPERYESLAPDTLLLSDAPEPPVYTVAAGVNAQDDAALEKLLDSLSFAPQPNAIYPAADGWNVRDADDSLRLTRTGDIYYHGGEGSDRYPVPSSATRTELVEITGQLVHQVMTPYSGAGRIYLAAIEEDQGTWSLTYRYTLSGADVQLGAEGWCARFQIRDGQIREYVLKLRRYTAGQTRAVLLPEYQAMYAMQALEAEGRQLLLRYYDNGSGTTAPSWIAR